MLQSWLPLAICPQMWDNRKEGLSLLGWSTSILVYSRTQESVNITTYEMLPCASASPLASI